MKENYKKLLKKGITQKRETRMHTRAKNKTKDKNGRRKPNNPENSDYKKDSRELTSWNYIDPPTRRSEQSC